MHPLYDEANEVVEKLRVARLEVVRLSAELARAEYDLRVTQARVERKWIKKAGGEKALAPTVEDRARILLVALDADEEYRAALERRDTLALRLDEARVEADALRNRLNVILAAMRGEEGVG
ncbi:MAG: hypothetical protein ACUVR6_08460 [Anaerolineae bacterium]